MSMSVSGMNEASKYLFNGAIQTLAGAWAASELLTPSPVGVLWGMSNVSAGAIFGATYYTVIVLAEKGLKAMLPLNDPEVTQTTKLVCLIARAVLGMVGGFFALKAIGISLTAAVVLRMTVYTFFNVFFMQSMVYCCCGDTNKPVTPAAPAPLPEPVQGRV